MPSRRERARQALSRAVWDLAQEGGLRREWAQGAHPVRDRQVACLGRGGRAE